MNLNGKVWAMYPPHFEEFISKWNAVDPSNFKNKHIETGNDPTEDDSENISPVQEIKVTGPIVPRHNLFTALFGGTSQNEIKSQLNEFESNEDVDKVVLDIDSPGGTASGLSSVADKIRNMKTDTVAFSDGLMASAAYFIGSAADKTIGSPDSMVGSIGTVSTIASIKEAQEDAGIETKVVRSSPNKAKPHPSEQIDEEDVKIVQDIVDKFNDVFVDNVAQNRNLSKDYVKNTMATGEVEVGSDAEGDFTDATMTREELYSSFEFDENAEMSRQEQQVEFLEEKVVEAKAEKEKMEENFEEKFESLEEDIEELKTETKKTKIEKRVDEVLGDKINPGNRETFIENFDSVEELNDVLKAIPSGKASPSSELETEDKGEDTDLSKIRQFERQGIQVARSESTAQNWERVGWEEGEDFVREENMNEYEFLLE